MYFEIFSYSSSYFFPCRKFPYPLTHNVVVRQVHPKLLQHRMVQQEILEENETLVRSFFSVCVFDESEAKLEKADKKIRETLNLARLRYYIPGYENLAAVHFACVPGQIHLMPRKYLFLTTLPIALCFLPHFVLVLSTIVPNIGSLIASQILAIVIIQPSAIAGKQITF